VSAGAAFAQARNDPGWGRHPDWEPYRIPANEYPDGDSTGQPAGAPGGLRVLNVTFRKPKGGRGKDRAGTWLRVAMVALAALAAAAAVVSYAAQYQMVRAVKTDAAAAIAALQAGIPDAGALVFAALGIALALHGKRALGARALNLVCVGVSLAMNALAASPGPRALAVWIMPAALYALASDTLIMVVRAHAIARQRELAEVLADEGLTPTALLGRLLLWCLRLLLAPPSTLAGFRAWVVEEAPVAPGRVAGKSETDPEPRTLTAGAGGSGDHRKRRTGGRRRGGARDWDALTEATRERYVGAGIDREAYERGDDLSAARGHKAGSAS
jgi:hypothetical protein